MILERVDQRSYKVQQNGSSIKIDLKPGTVTNKFDYIVDFIHELEEFHRGNGFSDWYKELLIKCKEDPENRFEILSSNLDKLKSYVDTFFDTENFDYSKFVNRSKAKKNSILFEPDEIERIQRVSSYLKLYAPIFNSKDMKLPEKLHDRIFTVLTKPIIEESQVASKLFEVVKSKSYRLTLTDRSMWDYVFAARCITPDSNVIGIFNFIMNEILVVCKRDANPIIFFTTVIDQSLNWFLRTVYTECYIYNDAISSEDIYSNPSVNNLKAYCYNDTIGRLVSFVYPVLDQIAPDKDSSNLDRVLTQVEHTSPLVECIVYPLLSQALNIPYEHFSTLAPKYAALLSLYMSYILQNAGNKYPTIVKYLKLYPTNIAPIKTTYKLKNLQDFLNKYDNFLGFKSVTKLFDILSCYIGKAARTKFYDLFTGEEVKNLPVSKLESEMIDLIGKNFSGQLDDLISKIRDVIYSHF